MNNLKLTVPIVQELREQIRSSDKLYGINKYYDMTMCEINMYHDAKNNKFDRWHDYDIFSILATCQVLRHKLSVINRRLLKVKAENRRLRKLLDGLKSIEIED